MAARHPRTAALPSKRFDDWPQQTLIAAGPKQRARRLIVWQLAPAARVAHPQEGHLLPLMAAVGTATLRTKSA